MRNKEAAYIEAGFMKAGWNEVESGKCVPGLHSAEVKRGQDRLKAAMPNGVLDRDAAKSAAPLSF